MSASNLRGQIIWEPGVGELESSGLTSYLAWLAAERKREFSDYRALWEWSTDELGPFWRSIWDYEDVLADGSPDTVLANSAMPGASWFPDVRLNYAEHLLRHDSTQPALLEVAEDGSGEELSWSELRRQAGSLASHLRRAGVGRGDCVVGYLGVGFEAVVALVAVSSLGAVWSVCAPEFGVSGVASRFSQLSPKVLIATSGYWFGGKLHRRSEEVARLLHELPSVADVVWVDSVSHDIPPLRVPASSWADVTADTDALVFERVPFDHPLWVLFSSGTTGTPKGIVHGHGGILLEHLKQLRCHADLRAGDRFLYVGSTSWMVFNLLVSGLLMGATVVLLKGSPIWPDSSAIWRTVGESAINIVGVGAGYVHACAKDGLSPGTEFDLSRLRQVSVTGSPLSPAGFGWLHDRVGDHIWPSASSGGTDVCSAFVGGCPLLPVRAGRLQAPCLGTAIEAWDDHGRAVEGTVGELVVRRPMPSMPLRFWGDRDGIRMRDAYFTPWPGVWRHGDYISFDADLSSVITGRSDSTLNRNGIRIGPAEVYAVVEALPEVREALIIGVEEGEGYYMPLFLELADGAEPAGVEHAVIRAIRAHLSPRHVPDEIVPMPGIPHTRTGKKLEVPIKRMLGGEPVDEVLDRSSVDRPEILETYAAFASRHVAQLDMGGGA